MPNTKLGKAMEFFDALVEVTDREGSRLVGNKARKAFELHTLSINDNILKNQIPADFDSNADVNYTNEYELETYLNTVATPQDRADLKLSEQIRRENTSEQRNFYEPAFPSLDNGT